jgi:glutathionyl-hydroquinone reductase
MFKTARVYLYLTLYLCVFDVVYLLWFWCQSKSNAAMKNVVKLLDVGYQILYWVCVTVNAGDFCTVYNFDI